LTNANNTIEGAGQIGDNSELAALNGPGGKIAANVSGGALSFNEGGGAFTNQGTVTVASGAKMVVYGDSNGFNQTQGASGLPLAQVDGELDTPNGLNLGAGALAGTGTVVGNVNNTGGGLNPGDPGSPGVLTVDGDYNQGSGGAFDERIKGSAVGTGYNELDATGAVTLDGALDVTLSGFAPTEDELFTIIMGGNGVSGMFATTSGLDYAGGHFDVLYHADNVQLEWLSNAPPVIPELSTWAMVGIGFAGLGLLGSRARQTRALTI
jgi:hypothetical protein